MIRAFSLDCLTLPDVTPIELIRIAAKTGYGSVSLWVQPPALFAPMLVNPAAGDAIASTLADHGVTLGNLEVFNLNTDDPLENYEPAIALGARLGARTATAIDYGAPRSDTADRLATFHALCARHGIATLVEPIAMGNVRTIEDGDALIAAAGVAAKLVVDCLHFVRTGTTVDRLRAIPAGRIGHVQLCDGPATIADDRLGAEATADRLYPGEGVFPLAAILAAVPPGATLGIEAPSLTRQQRGAPPIARARAALAAARRMLAA